MNRLFPGLAAALLLMAGGVHASPAVRLDNLGSYHRSIRTHSTAAQRWFDQGLRLVYAFNHDEAQRSFEEAARHDSTCAIAWWGAALALGPNINLPAMPDRAQLAYARLQRAKQFEGRASPVEVALISALNCRYAAVPPEDPRAQRALDSSYAAAMREVARRFPADDDVQVLFAESLMDLSPWNQWTMDGKPQPNTLEVVSTLERVIARSPRHPGANHYYIHAVEGSKLPGKALTAARRLAGMMPGAGHLVHMPSHVYARMGMYAEASQANRKAIRADDEYLARARPDGMYSMYVAHNHQFLLFTCMMEGRSAEALKEAHLVGASMPIEMLRQMPGFDFVLTYPDIALLRFGRWEETLQEPAPPGEFRFSVAIHHFARGVALTAQGHAGEAAAERDSLSAALDSMPPGAIEGLNNAGSLLGIARDFLDGEIQARAGHIDEACSSFAHAAAAEDLQHYDEPPDWCLPARHAWGAALLRADRPEEAERVYRADLARSPGNGWSLVGLAQSLRAGKKAAAARAAARFARAWKNADVKIVSSWF